MRNYINKIVSNLSATFDVTTKGGWSARKLSAFVVMVCIVVAHAAWLKRCFITDDFSLLSEILIIDYSFVVTVLGITTWQYLKEEKPKSKNNEID